MRRHTVILGAGATIAAIPDGDKNGRKSSVMNGLIEKLELQDVLQDIHLQTTSNNLEDIYSEMYSRPDCKEARNELEKRLYDYFDSLELPEEPTVYDFLVLSLTEKDIIATFNWDPLLIQAYARCHRFTSNLPHILCLHGNVALGYCSEHIEFGMKELRCPICGKPYPPVSLLYPVANKDYTKDEFIRKSWEAADEAIKESFMLTIFGYSAPSSDKEAVSLLKKAWGNLEDRSLEEVSVIDIVNEDNIRNAWKDFIYTHHYKYTNNFFDSYLGRFPRRSCETVFATYLLNVPSNGSMGFKEGMSWEEIEAFLYELMIEEEETPSDKNYPLHYAVKI